MPNLNIPMPEELLRELNIAAMRQGLKQKEYVPRLLALALREGWDLRVDTGGVPYAVGRKTP
jgi:hypothetical protein